MFNQMLRHRMLAVYLNDMKTLYFIKDIRGNEFYWRYRIDEGFTKEIKEATSFESEEEALKEFQQDYLEELFTNRLIEIVKVYSLNGLYDGSRVCVRRLINEKL